MRPGLFRCAVLEDLPGVTRPAAAATTESARPAFDEHGRDHRVWRERNPMWHEDEFSAWAEAKRQFRPPPGGFASTADWREVAAAIGVPTLLVCGGNAERFRIVNSWTANQAQELNPLIDVVRLAGAGHNVRRRRSPGSRPRSAGSSHEAESVPVFSGFCILL
jgi:pimeloyl-ACP methyl ester carboxylesterase